MYPEFLRSSFSLSEIIFIRMLHFLFAPKLAWRTFGSAVKRNIVALIYIRRTKWHGKMCNGWETCKSNQDGGVETEEGHRCRNACLNFQNKSCRDLVNGQLLHQEPQGLIRECSKAGRRTTASTVPVAKANVKADWTVKRSNGEQCLRIASYTHTGTRE